MKLTYGISGHVLLNSHDRLNSITEAHLKQWLTETQVQARFGKLPTYVPRLSQVQSDLLAVTIQTDRTSSVAFGNVAKPFVLMSLVKPFLLLFLLARVGREAVFSRVGIEPSDQPFHSIAQLASDRGRPRNPMINSGAIFLASLLPGNTPTSRCESLRYWLNKSAGCDLTLDEEMLASVQPLGNETNRSIANLLKRAGYLNDIDLAIETYNQICCLSGTVVDLARLGLLIALPHPNVSSDDQHIVNSLMMTCGLYEASSQYSMRIGLPIKSGVSGGLIAIVPKVGSIAIYSPAIDEIGNSVGGLFLLEQLVHAHRLSLFQTD
ncbi:MAG: glutaminase [Alkalinema sp. CAN_BIN05]|nr:glutaminase [Alkalinema sp. CAN_BIN05]